MTDWGIKVSETGYDVKTADDKNLSLKSGMTLLKVYDQDSLSVSSTGWNDVAHSLGYVPQYLVFVKDSSNNVYLAKGYFGAISLPVAISKMDAATMSIYKTDSGLVAFYYIFYEPVDTGTAPSITETNNYGVKISKDGVDVNSANILEQTFNSEKNSLKIIADDFSTSTASGGRSITIPHGLDFRPGFLVFYEVDNSGYWLFDDTREDLSGKGVSIASYADATNLNISVYSTSSATVKVHYYILADPGENA